MIQAVDGSGEVDSKHSGTEKSLSDHNTQLIQHGDYTFEQIPSQAFPHETRPVLFVFGNVIGWFFCGCYLLAETSFIWGISSSTASWVKLCLWIALLAELCLFFVDLTWALDAVISMLKPKKEGRRPHYKLFGEHAPHVDVFITCCGEPIDVIKNTIKAAATQDYPVSNFGVFVLDDGHDEGLRKKVEEFNEEAKSNYAKVHYRSREVPPGTRSFFKAGNLNFGIQETKKISNGAFLASLDSDMIIAHDWLRRMVPHLLLDTKLGLATSPQNFYNVPYGDPLAQQGEFTIWNSIFEPIHDHVGEAMCMGTGFVVRRAALDDIGGWPLAETGEDYMCSTKLMAKGWKIAYIRENMQHGITPESYQSRIKQRLRWVDAAFEVHQSNNWYLTNDLGDGVTLIDKAASWIFALRDLAAISTVWSLTALPIVLVFLSRSIEPLDSPSAAQSSKQTYLTPLLLTSFLASKIGDWIVYHRAGLTHLSNVQSMDVWAAPYCATRCLAYLFRTPSTKTLTFFVTGSHKDVISERNPRLRARLLTRLASSSVPLHLIYTTVCTAIVISCLHTLTLSSSSTSGSAAQTSSPLILPGHVLMLARATWKMAIPAWYMAFPPDVGAWKEHLVCDEAGVLRPKKSFPRYVSPDQGSSGAAGDEIGWGRVWRDGIEVCVLLVAVGASGGCREWW